MNIEFDSYKQKLTEIRPALEGLSESINLEGLRNELERLHAMQEAPGFWDNPENSQKIVVKTKLTESKIEKYELSIVMTCEVDSDDGENTTTFALVYKDRLYIEAEGEPLYECKINLDDLNMLADIADAAAYFGAELYSAESLPMAFSGRNNTIALIFGLKNANLGGFFAYLALEYPQTATVGIYTKLISGAKNDYSWN